MADDDLKGGNYDYHPNQPAAYFFAIIFGLSLLAHCYQAGRVRAWYLIPLLIATLGQVIGYIFRILATRNFTTLYMVIISQVCIIVSPAFLQAQLYMIVGRMMAYVGPRYSLIRHGAITKVFVIADILAILVQSSSSSMLSSDNLDTVLIGRKILIGGLAFQVAAFGVFLFFAITFDVKTRRGLGPKMDSLRALFTAFYVAAFLIIGRSIFRTIEFASVKFAVDEAQGYLITHEWPFFVLDSVPIFIATVLFNVWHPVRYLPVRKGLRMDGTYAIKPKHWWQKELDAPSGASSEARIQMEHV